MSYLWFTKSNSARNELACYCDFCMFQFRNVSDGLAPYWYRGLRLMDGEQITLKKVKKCMAIVMEQIEELDQPRNLQSLSASVIRNNLNGSTKNLPLPRLLQQMIAFHEYEDGDVNAPDDGEFSSFIAKHLLGILWQHLGWTLVRRCKHPWNQF